MRLFAVSDLHVDYEVNAKWVANLSKSDYHDDVLILAGDLTNRLRLLDWCLRTLASRFKKVLFVPGNHDLWVLNEGGAKTSFQKFDEVAAVVDSSGASMRPFCEGSLSIVPLLGWYDYSFGEPTEELRAVWMDYHACRWPGGFREQEIAMYFGELNDQHVSAIADKVITFSHFLPRIDLMPEFFPQKKALLYPVLGSTRLEDQLRLLNPSIHIYGHSHVNRNVTIDGIAYINNAFGYPHETRTTSKRLVCVLEC
jgi:3',5'-cyclic AMP phosphodiesterase CpdA